MQVYHYHDIPAQEMPGYPGVAVRWAIGENVGAPNFILRVIDVQPGAATEYHTHAWEHEVLVLEGQGFVRDAQGETAIGPGSCVYIAPRELHQLINRAAEVLRFVCVIPRPLQA